MSEYIFRLPDLGEGTVECEIAEWQIKVGDEVIEESVVVVMLTDKAAVEISSPVAGKVVSLAGEPGDMIAVGAALIIFETRSTAPTQEPPLDDFNTRLTETPTQAPSKLVTPPPHKQLISSPSIRRKAREAGIDLALVQASGAGSSHHRGQQGGGTAGCCQRPGSGPSDDESVFIV